MCTLILGSEKFHTVSMCFCLENIKKKVFIRQTLYFNMLGPCYHIKKKSTVSLSDEEISKVCTANRVDFSNLSPSL